MAAAREGAAGPPLIDDRAAGSDDGGGRAVPREGVAGIALSPRTEHARRLFAGVAPQYEVVSTLWSFGQDGRWRRFMASRVTPGSRVLDVATGTGLVARELERRGCDVVGLDQSWEMLRTARGSPRRVQAQAERLPFHDGAVDAVTFTYLM